MQATEQKRARVELPSASIAEIDLQALASNLQRLKAQAGDADICGVVKANAYGHGAALIASALQKQGVTHFAVATLIEGLALREAGVSGDILILSGACWWNAPTALLRAKLTAVIGSAEEVTRLDFAAQSLGLDAVPIHLALDTGMGREGVFCGEEPVDTLEPILGALLHATHLHLTGVMTHFANADLADAGLTELQITRFQRGIETIFQRGLKPEILHVENSAATLISRQPKVTRHMKRWVRPGIALYGVSPGAPKSTPSQMATGLRPVLRWTAPIIHRKVVPENTPVSYGSTWVAKRESHLLVLGVGYADGYRRALGNCGEVLVGGHRAKVVGRVCMDMCVVDVTDCIDALTPSQIALGAPVTLLGAHGEQTISAWDLAALTGTIGYEILTSISARVKRVAIGSSRDQSAFEGYPVHKQS